MPGVVRHDDFDVVTRVEIEGRSLRVVGDEHGEAASVPWGRGRVREWRERRRPRRPPAHLHRLAEEVLIARLERAIGNPRPGTSRTGSLVGRGQAGEVLDPECCANPTTRFEHRGYGHDVLEADGQAKGGIEREVPRDALVVVGVEVVEVADHPVPAKRVGERRIGRSPEERPELIGVVGRQPLVGVDLHNPRRLQGSGGSQQARADSRRCPSRPPSRGVDW